MDEMDGSHGQGPGGAKDETRIFLYIQTPATIFFLPKGPMLDMLYY